jgi:hypothetical protein
MRPARLSRAVRCAAVALLAAASVPSGARLADPARPSVATAAGDRDEAGALIGDLVFHADLMRALDGLCPRRDSTDWHAALADVLEQAFTPELRDLSRRLGADAGARMVRERGGCHTRAFAAAYDESRAEYQGLLARWRALGD